MSTPAVLNAILENILDPANEEHLDAYAELLRDPEKMKALADSLGHPVSEARTGRISRELREALIFGRIDGTVLFEAASGPPAGSKAGKNAPGEGWVNVWTGPKGGKYWARKGSAAHEASEKDKSGEKKPSSEETAKRQAVLINTAKKVAADPLSFDEKQVKTLVGYMEKELV